VTVRRRPVVAIDGPAGAGKSTVAAQVAERLGYLLLGTGSLYRSVALAARRAGIGWDHAKHTGRLAQQLAKRQAIRLVAERPGDERVWLDGEDVSAEIRTEQIGEGASQVSAHPEVRAALLCIQRDAGREGGVVVEGRDIGTAVFPDAEAKFFLTASVQVRAQRRYAELAARGLQVDLQEIAREVQQRDERDRSRAVAPLRQAADAELIDSSELGVEQVVERIATRVREVEVRMADPS
jgi:cytidylate kinase